MATSLEHAKGLVRLVVSEDPIFPGEHNLVLRFGDVSIMVHDVDGVGPKGRNDVASVLDAIAAGIAVEFALEREAERLAELAPPPPSLPPCRCSNEYEHCETCDAQRARQHRAWRDRGGK